MTTISYLVAWLIYLLAAGATVSMLWNFSSTWRPELARVSRLSLIVILFTPYFSDPQQYKLAPAFLICFFELVFGDQNIALKATIPLLLLLLLLLCSSFIINLARKIFRNKRPPFA